MNWILQERKKGGTGEMQIDIISGIASRQPFSIIPRISIEEEDVCVAEVLL